MEASASASASAAAAADAASPPEPPPPEQQRILDNAKHQFGLQLVTGQRDPHTRQLCPGYGLRCSRTLTPCELVATVPGTTLSHRDLKTDPRFKGLRYTLTTTRWGAQFVFHGYQGALNDALARNFTFSWGDDAAWVAVQSGSGRFRKMSVAHFKAEYGTHLCGYDADKKTLDVDRTTHLIMMHDAAIAMANDAAFNAPPGVYAQVSARHNNVECMPYVHFVAKHDFDDARFAGTMELGPGLVALASQTISGTPEKPVDIFIPYGANNGR